MTEVMLLKDIKRLGRAGDIKRVKDGYARNYLIPRGLAVVATKGASAQARERLSAESRRRETKLATDSSVAGVIDQVSLTFVVKAGETGTLYGSVTNADIAAKLEEQTGEAVDKRKVLLEQPIKELGTYPVKVKLGAELSPTITVVVEAESED